MALLVVSVKPGAHANAVVVSGKAIEVRIREPARDGLANEAARRLLAAKLGIAASRVTLVRGAAARLKAFEVRDFERDDALRLLAMPAERGKAVLPSKRQSDGL